MRIIILLLVALLLLFSPLPVLAMDEPDSVTLYDIEAFKDLSTAGDILFIVPYNIPFTVQPDDTIDKTFLFQILSADGATINGTVTAYPRYTGGYGYGLVTFYFESGMTWGTAYKFRVLENPAFYTSPQYWDFNIGASQYSSDTDQAEALRAKILDLGAEFTISYAVDLLSTSESGGTVLSTYGELYFANAIPGLQTFSPTLFATQIESPDYTKRTWTYALADSMQTRYAGTFIGNFMTGYAGLFNVQTSSAMNVLAIILFVILMVISVWKFKGTMMSVFIDGFALLLLLMLIGWFNMIYAGLLAFLSVMAGGIVLFLNRSS